MTIATPSPTTAADLAAFRHQHPADGITERHVATLGNGQSIIQTRYVFEIFRFHDAATDEELVFDVRGIKAAMVAGKLKFQMRDVESLDPDWVEHIRTHGGVEAKRMAQLTAADLERPGIAVYWPHNNFTTLIDGNNRLCRRYDVGLRTFRMATITMDRSILPWVCEPGNEEQFIERDHPSMQHDRVRLGDVIKDVVGWEFLHPSMRHYHLGSLPGWLHHDDPRPAREQLDAHYRHGGGWQPFKGHTLAADNSLHYPGDPPLLPLAQARLRDELIVFYDHSWVAIIQPDRNFEVCRMD